MHNSLFIHDLLKKTNSDPMRVARRDPHRRVMRDPAARAAAGEFELSGAWAVRCHVVPEVDPVVQEDVADFLARMGVCNSQTTEDATITFVCAADDGLGERDCRLSFQPGRIVVQGGSVTGVWAGVAWLEWEMRTRRGPFLPMGEFERRAAWPVQISQGPWGGNYSVPDFGPEYLSDDAFRLYAHYGVNRMMIYGDMLCYANSDILPELSTSDAEANIAVLRDAARRAGRYGVQFSYVVVGPKLRPNHPVFVNHPNTKGTGVTINGQRLNFLCSSDEEVLAFYRETFNRLFREVPELAGLVLIVAEESFYHCKMWRLHASEPCPRCASKTTEQAIADVLRVVDEAVRDAQPQAWVAAWPYTTDQWERPNRVEFIHALPEHVALWLAIEKDQHYRKGDYVKHVWDYSIDFTGPSDVMRLASRIAHETGHRLFVKTETGIGLEVFQFPYVPAMQQLADKWQRVRELAPFGVQQSWLFFGMFGSRAEELGLWAAYGGFPRDEFLRRIAMRDFGSGAAEQVTSAWAHMSEAVRHLPCVTLTNYYIGPSFLGPAHPLVPQKGDEIPDVFDGYLFYLQEAEETFSRRQIEKARTCLVMDSLPDTARAVSVAWDGDSDGWDIVIREYAAAAGEAEVAWEQLQHAQALARTPADQANLREELLLTELVYLTQRSCEHVLRFLQARRAHEQGDASAWDEMKRVAALERENALAAVHVYDEAPWLDLAERTDGKFSRCADMIAAKVAWIDRFRAEERAVNRGDAAYAGS
jgi:hypothetical protein